MQTFAPGSVSPSQSVLEIDTLQHMFPTRAAANGLNESVENTLDLIDATLVHQVLGKLSLDESELAANKPALAEQLPQENEAMQAFYQFIGKPCVAAALEQTVPEGKGSEATLAKSVFQAKEGNAEAEARVNINIATATCEALFKRKHLTRIYKKLSDSGEVIQLGLTTEQIHLDSIVHRSHRPAALKEFTKAEVRNGLREQQLAREGVLDDAWFIVASFVPKDMPEDWLDHRGDGYFTRTMTYSLQGTTKHEADIITETVFDQGTAASEKASYEDRQAQRFDVRAYQKVCEWLGLPVPATELEALGQPLVIPKKLMPNGMIDFWRWMDVAADEIQGNHVVRAVEEYLTRDALSREREASLSGVQQAIKEELLAVENFTSDFEAIELLWKLTRKHGYKESVNNNYIEPLVFGVKAAQKLVVAKNFLSLKQFDEVDRWIELGLQDASVSGCGGGSCGLRDVDPASPAMSKAKDLLHFEDGDSVTIDEERPCPKCSTVGTVVYVYNDSGKLNKGCLNPQCGATEFRATK